MQVFFHSGNTYSILQQYLGHPEYLGGMIGLDSQLIQITKWKLRHVGDII